MPTSGAWRGFALGVVSTAAVWGTVAGMGSAQATSPPQLERAAFHKTIDDVLDRYVDPVDESVLLGRGLKHVVAGLDPHSHFFTAQEREELRARAQGGVSGLSTSLRTDARGGSVLEVVGVLPHSAAAQAQLAPGDHVLSIRGRPVERIISQADAEALLVGKVTERLELTVQRAGSARPEDLALELTGLGGSKVEGKLVPVDGGNVACIRIHRFGPGTGEATKKSLAALRRRGGEAKLRGIVLDLRSNPGGEIDEALVVADLFVRKGILTQTIGRGGRLLREEKAHPRGTDAKTPIAVLIDRHSASAAELLTAALQDHGRATVVGERSYGKGTVQDVTGLSDGSLIALTIARYHSPKGRQIDEIGIRPDVAFGLQATSDFQAVSAAIEALGLQTID